MTRVGIEPGGGSVSRIEKNIEFLFFARYASRVSLGLFELLCPTLSLFFWWPWATLDPWVDLDKIIIKRPKSDMWYVCCTLSGLKEIEEIPLESTLFRVKTGPFLIRPNRIGDAHIPTNTIIIYPLLNKISRSGSINRLTSIKYRLN